MKRTPLKRKVSLRDSYLRKLKARGTEYVWKRNGKAKRKRPLKKVSRSQRTRLQGYYARQQEFLKRDENQLCEICCRRREHGENIPINAATEIHHRNGRIGKLLMDERHWIPSCFWCRSFPHTHPREAREMGLLAPANEWNVSAPVSGN